MAKLFKWLVVLFLPLFGISLSSCGDDDKDEPDKPGQPSSVSTKETISFPGYTFLATENSANFCEIYFNNLNDNSNSDYQSPDMSWIDGALILSKGYYSWGENLQVIYVGKINSLKEINSLPTATTFNSWNKGKKLFEKGGYIIEGTSNLYYSYLGKNGSLTGASFPNSEIFCHRTCESGSKAGPIAGLSD